MISINTPVKQSGSNPEWWKLVANITKDGSPNHNEKIKLSIKNKLGKLITIGSIPFNFIQSGPVGGVSKAGSLNYPAGNWNKETIYEKGMSTTPYVYVAETDKYYLLDKQQSQGQKPGESSDWKEISKEPSIYTELLLANNAQFGSKFGAVFYNNYMYSQCGLNKNNEFIHYSAVAEDMFKESDNKNISEFTGEFIPNTNIDFYAGSISCNKLSEKYDYFYPFSIKDVNTDVALKYIEDYTDEDGDWRHDYTVKTDSSDDLKAYDVIFHNTYYMDFSKSQNLCILPRIVKLFIPNPTISLADNDEYKVEYYRDNILNTRYSGSVLGKDIYKGIDSEYCVNRPGVVVMPSIDSEYIKDGARVHITYPLYQLDNTKCIHSFKTKYSRNYDKTDHIYGNKDDYGQRADTYGIDYEAIYDPNKVPYDYIITGYNIGDDEPLPYIANNNLINSTEGYIIVCANYSMISGKGKGGYFLWRDKKCDYVMLSPGSELKLRTVVEENYSLNFNSSLNQGASINSGSTKKGNIVKAEKNIYWVIENSNDLSPIDIDIALHNNPIKNTSWADAMGEGIGSGDSRYIYCYDVATGPYGYIWGTDGTCVSRIKTLYSYNALNQIVNNSSSYINKNEGEPHIALGSGSIFTYKNTVRQAAQGKTVYEVDMDKKSIFSAPEKIFIAQCNYGNVYATGAELYYYGDLNANYNYTGGRLYVDINCNSTADNSIVRMGNYDIYGPSQYIDTENDYTLHNMLSNAFVISSVGEDTITIGSAYTSTILTFNGSSFNWFMTGEHATTYVGMYMNPLNITSIEVDQTTDSTILANLIYLFKNSYYIWDSSNSAYTYFSKYGFDKHYTETEFEERMEEFKKEIMGVHDTNETHYLVEQYINCGYNYMRCIY